MPRKRSPRTYTVGEKKMRMPNGIDKYEVQRKVGNLTVVRVRSSSYGHAVACWLVDKHGSVVGTSSDGKRFRGYDNPRSFRVVA